MFAPTQVYTHETIMFQNDWTRSHFIYTVHHDNTKPVYIQNYVGVYLALGRKGERRERGGEEVRERERKIERQRIKDKQNKVFV